MGNTDGKHFRNTKLGDYTLSIDGFIIKDNTGKTVPQVMDELKALVNSDEPQQLIFDIFPDRYFNAIFTGAEEYDATDLKYTPLTLTFDVPDGMAHAIQTIGFSNTYSTTTNLMLDSEYNAMTKYMKSWVKKLYEKFNDSNVVQGDFTNGVPLNFERDKNSDERWLNWNPRTMIHTTDLKVGDEVNFSVYAQVLSIDEENDKNYAGQVILEEWDTVKSAILKRHIVYIPKKVTTEFTEYGSVVKIENEKTNAINLQYGFRGSNLIKWSKPMISFLPPLGATVTAPSVGAKAFSNSLDFGDYDYSGNPNLLPKLDYSKLSRTNSSIQTPPAYVKDHGTYFEVDLGDPSASGIDRNVCLPLITRLGKGKTYTISANIMISDGMVIGKCPMYYAVYRNLPTAETLRPVVLYPSADNNGNFVRVSKTFTIPSDFTDGDFSPFLQWYFPANAVGKYYVGYDIKIEEGSTATPYQPNLLDAPYYLSKTALGENILNPVSFPINTTEYMAANFTPNEPYVADQKYTFTMKATKPANQYFAPHLRGGILGVGAMTPVAGLTDVWQITFTVTQEHVDGGANSVNVFQMPQSSKGTVNIEWAKLEKGDTRTPNIPYYKYEGIAPAPSNNPKEYHWGYSPSYINAVEYVSSGESVGDLIKIENNGTYRTKPRFSFRMKGENGLVALLNQNGSILQFGNPEDVDGTTSSRVERGLNEGFWGNTLNSALQINTGFKSVYPNMNSNSATPNLVQGTWDMRQDPDAATPVFKGVGDIQVWHGPTIMADIAAPSNTDRTLPISNHFRFIFDNYDKGQRGRIEFATFDELGNPIMTAIIRDSTQASNELIFEAWYKNKKLHEKKLDRKVFTKAFYEMNMDRRGNRLIWRMVQIKSLNNHSSGWSQAAIDKEYKFTWTLPEPDTSKFSKIGLWTMRYSNKYHVIMRVTDMQARWEGTPYYQDLRNYFQDGDIVEIDTATRELYVNGVVNNQLNVVGNQWEQFELETGETIIQPIVSEWANMPEVTADVRQNYL